MKATHIFVIQSGWVFVGTCEDTETNTATALLNAACIRHWGTTRGLGELALNGPTDSTILDPCGTVEFPRSSILFYIPVVKSKWR